MPRELIVSRHRAVAVLVAAPAVAPSLDAILQARGARALPLFVNAGPPSAVPAAAQDELLHVEAPDPDLDQLAADLQLAGYTAYVKPAGEPPNLNAQQPSLMAPAATTPNYLARQGYLALPPAGVGATKAWSSPGGDGAGVRVADLEWAWEFQHEDLPPMGVLYGTAASTDTDHGTAVVGVIGAKANGYGVTGIVPAARLDVGSFEHDPTARVIDGVASKLQPGDVMILEIHRSGPGANGHGQDGYIAIEWWPDDFEAIQRATRRGIIVIEAAGNGYRDLDSAIYDQPAAGFPPTWTNPFRRGNPDAGAVIVGAGAPPSGNYGPDRSRLDFSNHGRCVDAQGWGREVVTTGYGDLQGGASPRRWYTETFSGTSSASPIVAGAVAAVQGMRKAAGLRPLTSLEARAMLRATGTPQQASPTAPLGERIGSRPDIAAAYAWAAAAYP